MHFLNLLYNRNKVFVSIQTGERQSMTTELTLDEKLQLLTLKNDWQTEDCGGKIQSIFLADGPHGLRKIGEDAQTGKCN